MQVRMNMPLSKSRVRLCNAVGAGTTFDISPGYLCSDWSIHCALSAKPPSRLPTRTMAEVAGLVIGAAGLVGLFDACITAFDLVQVARTQDKSFEVLCARLDLAETRFIIWGQALGLDDPTSHDPQLNSPKLHETIARTCRLIIELFNDCKKYEGRYGLKRWLRRLRDDGGATGKEYRSPFRATFARMRGLVQRRDARPDGDMAKRPHHVIRWVIVDKKAFTELVDQLQALIEGLEAVSREIVPNFKQRRTAIARLEIESISDEDSLRLLQEASINQDDDAISDAISAHVLSESRRNGGSHLPTTLALTSAAESFYTASEGRRQDQGLGTFPSTNRVPAEFAQFPGHLFSHMGSVFSSAAEQDLADIHKRNVQSIRYMLSTYTNIDAAAGMLPEAIEAVVVAPLEQDLNVTSVTWNIIPYQQRALRNHLPILCTITGPRGSPYEDGVFELIVLLHADGSAKALTFLTPILHPHYISIVRDYLRLTYLDKPGSHDHLRSVLHNVRSSLIRPEDWTFGAWTETISDRMLPVYARQNTSNWARGLLYSTEGKEHRIAQLCSFLSELEKAKMKQYRNASFLAETDTSIIIMCLGLKFSNLAVPEGCTEQPMHLM